MGLSSCGPTRCGRSHKGLVECDTGSLDCCSHNPTTDKRKEMDFKGALCGGGEATVQMQRAGGPGALGGPGGPSGLDEDVTDGDLGDGSRTKARTELGLRPELGSQRNQTWPCSSLCSQDHSRRASAVCSEAQNGAGGHWPLRNTRTGGELLMELSKEELIDRLQNATETIQVLESELEVAHRYLEGKYAALKILQGQAILDKATSHTKNLLQKSEQRAKALEKEANVLQWELTLSQLQLRRSEQSFEKNFYRMLSERNSLSEALKQSELEKEQLRVENLALSAQYVELQSKASPQTVSSSSTKATAPPRGDSRAAAAPQDKPQSIYPPTKAVGHGNEPLDDREHPLDLQNCDDRSLFRTSRPDENET